MICTDYNTNALPVLLDRNCISERYYPLIPYVDTLLPELDSLGCRVKSDVQKLPDEVFRRIGMQDPGLIRLLRRFLMLYDPNPGKFREIDVFCQDPEMQAAFRELYCLPGVRRVRAELYYRAGYRSVSAFASAAPEEIIDRTTAVIQANSLPCTVPFLKEVRTQIAVARAFMM